MAVMMRESVEDDLKAIGLALDNDVMPSVFDRGVVRPVISPDDLKLAGQEKMAWPSVGANWRRETARTR